MTHDLLFSSAEALPLQASLWLGRLESGESDRGLREIHGNDENLLQSRRSLLINALKAYISRFGDRHVRIFRAPGRVNLRGMHVDTHGGWLNLMTHQREVLLIASPSEKGQCTVANTLGSYGETRWDHEKEKRAIPAGACWMDLLTRDGFRPAHDGWSNYCLGAALWLDHHFSPSSFVGMDALVASDLPVGASLSSSTALNLVFLLAFSAFNGLSLNKTELIAASREVEWYAGARSGVSDQTALLLGERGSLFQVALHPDALDLSGGRHIAFPDELALLIIDSCTTRSLSGPQRVRYSLNRFAYSMALTVLQSAMREQGREEEEIVFMDRLSRITPEALGGLSAFVDLMKAVPEYISLEALKERYAPPDLEVHYGQYFEGVAEEDKPHRIPLRGPLLFGIAESARALRFAQALEEADFALAGRLMTLGHEGDRVRDRHGHPFQSSVRDKALDQYLATHPAVEFIPGCYGASSPALDRLVDVSLEGGALGASLTGAGIAGVVMVLCHRHEAEQLAQELRDCLQSPDYAALAGEGARLESVAPETRVIVNHAVAGAGEIRLSC
ncbi:MAG: hypothetical protein GX130_12230 [Candidatus Hydrogenedens sp.]|nr:hypothetical protein [Candidatus Hydrogenedens sp.]